MSHIRSKRYVRLLCLALLLAVLAACSSSTDPGPDPEPKPDPDPTETELALTDLVTDEIGVVLNPNGVTPLAAEASFTTRIPTRVILTVPGEEPVTQSFEEATEHRLPILGLYPDTNNQVTLRLESAEGYAETTESIQTGALPAELPSVEIVTAKREQMEPGWNLSALRIGEEKVRYSPFISDPAGDIRWYIDLSFAGNRIGLERLTNGNFFFGAGDTIYEYDMLGAEINTWELPNGTIYHHDIVEKSDGNFIIAVSKGSLATVDDIVIEIDRNSGEVVREWDFRQVLDIDRQTYEEEVEDWLHVNAVWYDERDDTLIVSGRNQGVIKVTMENELVWILAPHKGWEQAGPDGNGLETSDYLLTAVDENGDPYPNAVQQGEQSADTFDWTWGQHAPMVLPNGNLFVFDNGRKRNFVYGEPFYSRGVEYTIDKDVMTVEQVWEYGKERGDALYSQIISDVDYLPETGNRLIVPGVINFSSDPPSQAVMTEVTHPGKEVVFEATIEFTNLFGEVMSYKDISYRSERLPLYPTSTTP